MIFLRISGTSSANRIEWVSKIIYYLWYQKLTLPWWWFSECFDSFAFSTICSSSKFSSLIWGTEVVGKTSTMFSCISLHQKHLFSPKKKGEHEIWQYGLYSFQTGYTRLERFLHKNQHTQRKSLNFGSFHSSIIFDAKIEISPTKWVEKTPIYLFSTFGSKINEFEPKKSEKNKKIPTSYPIFLHEKSK